MTNDENKIRLEEKITRIAEEIFALPKEERENSSGGSAEFKTLKIKLAENVWRWAEFKSAKKEFKHLKYAGKEIMECINRSITSYKGETDGYIKYISASVSAEIKRANEKQRVFESQKDRVPEKKRRVLRHMIRYAEERGADTKSAKTQWEIAAVFGYTAQDVADLLLVDFQSDVQSESIMGEDGNESSLFDTVAIAEKHGYGNADSDFVLHSELKARLSEIDGVFKNQQGRTKPYLSALVTHKIFKELESAKVNTDTIAELLHGLSFAETAEAMRVMQSFFSAGEFVTQEEVASWFKRDKTDASRAMKGFCEKVREN